MIFQQQINNPQLKSPQSLATLYLNLVDCFDGRVNLIDERGEQIIIK